MVITDTLARSLRELPRPIGTARRRSCENCDGAKFCTICWLSQAGAMTELDPRYSIECSRL